MNQEFIDELNRDVQRKLLTPYKQDNFRKLMRGESIILMCTLGTILGTAIAYGF